MNEITSLWQTSEYHARGRRQYGIEIKSGKKFDWNWSATGKRPQLGEIIDPSKHGERK